MGSPARTYRDSRPGAHVHLVNRRLGTCVLTFGHVVKPERWDDDPGEPGRLLLPMGLVRLSRTVPRGSRTFWRIHAMVTAG